MRTKVTLILLLLNVALFFVIYKTRDKDPFQKDPAILSETSNIQTLVIASSNPDVPTKKIEHGTDVAWTLTEPIQWPANEFAVNRIVSELQQLRSDADFTIEEITKGGRTLADYGLDNPPLTLTYTPSATAKNIVLKIGKTTPAGNRLYVLSPDGKTIHVVNRSLVESLALPLDELRSDVLFTIPVFEARTFKLQPKKPDIGAPPNPTSIDYDGGRWVFSSPFKTNDVRANKAATVRAINWLHELRAKEFVDPKTIDNTRTGLATPELQITLIGNNRRETLLLGARIEPSSTTPATTKAPASDQTPTVEYYAKMEDKAPTFKIALPVQLKETLDNAQETLRDPHVFDFDPSSVTTITLSAPNTPQVTLQRLESATPGLASSLWQVVRNNGESGPQTHPADRERIEKLLEALARLSAERFVTDSATASELENFGFNRPAREIALTFARQPAKSFNTVTTLQIGAKSETDPYVFAKLTSQSYIYRVPTSILADTPTATLAYRDRLIRELPAGALITGLKLTDLANNTPLLDVTLPLPATADQDPTLTPQRRAAIEALAAQLRTLRAKKLLRDEFPATLSINGEERPWRYRLDTTITLGGGAGTQTTANTLYFTERIGGTTQYAGLPDLLLVIEADQPLIDSLFALAYGPKDPGSIPEPPPTAKAP